MKKVKLIAVLCLFVFFQINAQSVQNNTLNAKERSIVGIASLTAKGDLETLKPALAKGLEAGLTVNEIKEVLVHVYAYCGFPRSIRGLQAFITVLDERKAKGIADHFGKNASEITDNRTKYERGKEILESLTQTKLSDTKPAYQQFSPEIDVFLKEHLFADIFERNVLNFQQRELATISVLISLGKLEPMLRSHLNICLIQGFSLEQLQEAVALIKPNTRRKNIKSAKLLLKNLAKK